jgi:hypothetical protein
MGINTPMAFWISVAQLPIMVGLALHYPTVRIDVYDTSIRTVIDPATNQTVVAGADKSAVQVSSYEHGMGISGLYVLSSASFAFFAVLTMNFIERGVVVANSSSSSDMHRRSGGGGEGRNAMANEEYVSQNVGMVADPTFRTWNQVRKQVLKKKVQTFACVKKKSSVNGQIFGNMQGHGSLSRAKKMKVRIFRNQEHWSVFQGTGSSNMHFLAFSISGPPRSDGQLARVL